MRAMYPNKAKVISQTTGSSIQLGVEFDRHHVPDGVDDWLKELMWFSDSCCPDTGESLYRKGADPNYYTWYEACAYEWYKMMSLGGR